MDIQNKNKKVLITLGDNSMSMMNKLKDYHGYMSNAEVIRNAISVLYAKTFKDYLAVKDMKNASTEELAQRKIEIEEQKERLKKEKEEERVMEIVKALDGTISTRPDGERVCKWFVHQLRADYPQEMKLDQLTPDLPKYMWVPNKKTVLEFRAKQK